MSEPVGKEIGTLVVIVLKANHLPNKRHIGKQDPYCVVTINNEKRRTKAIKKGGQHPEWDEEIRFTVYEDTTPEPPAKADGGTPPPPPPKNGRSPPNIVGGRTMKLACYADDPREPDLIGETNVDLTEVLTKGETDEWFTLMHKDRFAGKVFLELTFYSNEPPPEAKPQKQSFKPNKSYAGPGTFVPTDDMPASLQLGRPLQSRIASTSVLHDRDRRQSESFSSQLRPSNSLAQLDLYSAPYETRRPPTVHDELANGFSEHLSLSSRHGVGEDFPPAASNYGISASVSQQAMSTYPQNPDFDYPASYDGQPYGVAASISYNSPTAYQPPLEGPPSSYRPPTRGPRHSIPSSSSGFMPISNSTSSFVPFPSHTSEQSTLGIPLSHTPTPSVYPTSSFQTQPGFIVPAPTPASSVGSTLPQVPSSSYGGPYAFGAPPPMAFPPNGEVPHGQLTYMNYPTDSYNAPAQSVLSSSSGPGSRPLPLPQPYNHTLPPNPGPLPPAPVGSAHNSPIHGSSPVVTPVNGYMSVPPPPPIPSVPMQPPPSEATSIPPPPPLPTPPQFSSTPPRRQTSLPQPPTLPIIPVQSHYQTFPPPPPPLTIHPSYIPGPPPRPPTGYQQPSQYVN